MSVRQIGHRVPRHARGRHTSSKIVDAHTAPSRSEGCEVRSNTPRSCRCPSLVYIDLTQLTVGLAVDVDHISMISVVVVDVLVPARIKARVDITWTVLQHEYTQSRDSVVLTNSYYGHRVES